MPSDRDEPGRVDWPLHRLTVITLAIVAVATLIYVARLVDEQTIQIVANRRLLPRWDLAAHLNHGWEDYHLLVTARLHRFLWDLWLQGYWPPVLSIYQIPFYLVSGGRLAAGLRSALAAFVITGVLGCVLMWRQWRQAAALPAALFLTLLMSSPYLLAYASVTMTEMLGAAAQLAVLLAYVVYRQHPGSCAARALAVSLTVLFFTKYNYFFLLAVPLVIYDWLDRSPGSSVTQRGDELRLGGRYALSSPAVWLLAGYGIALLVVMRTGGFEFHLAGHRISVHTVGNSGYIVLYLLLARLWYLHRQGRIPWLRLFAADPRVRPLLVWLVIPVTIWLASPYPNHIRDFFNLVINRPLGESTVGAGVETYLDTLRTTYFYSEWVLVCVAAVFVIAAARYRRQPPLMRWLVFAIPLQLAVIALHQTRFPRFLLLTVVLLCVAAASEVGRWFAGSTWARTAGFVAAPVVLGLGVMAAKSVVTEERFRTVAFENYTDNSALRDALDVVRDALKPDDRLAVVGQGNELSPALLRWELGPPSGIACSPFEIGGARGENLALATRVLLLIPASTEPGPLDLPPYYFAQRQAVLDAAARGDLVLRREILVDTMQLALRLYEKTSTPPRVAPCE